MVDCITSIKQILYQLQKFYIMKNTLITFLLLVFALGIGNQINAQNYVETQEVKTAYIYPTFANSSYRFLRLAEGPSIGQAFGGLMHNYNSDIYGNGNDFSIFSYSNKDIVLQPSGTGELFVYSNSTSTNTDITLNLRETRSSGAARIRFKVEDQDHHWDIFARNRNGSGDNEFNIWHSDVGNILSINAVSATTSSRNGRVGINDTSPSYTLECNGSAGKPGGGSWSNSSDKRLKKNIKSFSKGLDLIEHVRPVSFEYNGKDDLPTDQEYVGVIAQELKKIAPFMVSEYVGNDGETYLSVDPSAFDFVLINAVKELSERINSLESDNKDLVSKLNTMINNEQFAKRQ